MSLVINEPTSLVAVNDQCEMVERWAETCESVAELREATNRLAAIDEYLNRTSIEGRGRLAATMRRLEVRIGQVLGRATGRGRPTGGNLRHDVNNLSHQHRHEFRDMAEHADLVEALAEQSTDDQPLSRRKVLQAIADAERQLEHEREIRQQARDLEAKYQPEDFDPVADAELTRQRGALLRLCRDIAAFGDPDDFVDDHHDYIDQLRNTLPTAEAARQWLESFIAAIGGRK